MLLEEESDHKSYITVKLENYKMGKLRKIYPLVPYGTRAMVITNHFLLDLRSVPQVTFNI